MSEHQVSKMSVPELNERWQRHIGHIAEEATFMATHRNRYRTVARWLWMRPHRRIVNRHMQAFGWITQLWLPAGLMYVRRELDDQHGSVSLKQLFREMESRPDALEGLPPEHVATDRADLDKRCANALMFAQRQLAHRAYWDEPFVSGQDLDEAMDAISYYVHKYHHVLTEKHLESEDVEPDLAWLQSFTVPWYKPRKKQRQMLERYARMADR